MQPNSIFVIQVGATHCMYGVISQTCRFDAFNASHSECRPII